ncbi:MAG: hypothetical protein JO112_16105, partial [Planctomycetes bacterium]|nr:hypothetical protein [Planctomycetota bacterium]
DKTVVSTVRCHRVARVQGQTATFDAGVTIRQAMDVLGRAGKELHVLPNYSYVSLGTSFFVPIHGSAAEYSTLGDTIEKVVLYDPAEDRLLVADRKKEPFRQHLYNLKSDVLLLRLTLRVKEKTRYFVQRQTLASPTSAELLAAFHDPMPSHVEVRKGKAASRTVEVCRYYTGIPPSNTSTLEVPRDALGRLWDLIEANPLSRVLFHGLMRRYGYHVELFFNADEFAVFWDTHGRLPLAKIQLRYIRRDGFPHSPFREHDCISADLFLLKKHQEAFERYVKETFRAVQFNPGKHSL